MRTVDLVEKTCPKCEQTLPLTDFFKDRQTSSGLRTYCKSCDTARVMARRERKRAEDLEGWTAERRRALRLHRLKTYGITPEAYEALLDAQGGVCAICERPESRTNQDGVVCPLSVDHDHGCCSGAKSCGKCVRGLLCNACNTALGRFDDSLDRLTSAAAYLLAHGGGSNQDQ